MPKVTNVKSVLKSDVDVYANFNVLTIAQEVPLLNRARLVLKKLQQNFQKVKCILKITASFLDKKFFWNSVAEKLMNKTEVLIPVKDGIDEY